MDNNIELIQLLLQATKDRKISWTYGGSENSFRVALSSAMFTIQKRGGNVALEGYNLSMTNGSGRPIVLMEEIKPFASEGNMELMSSLYENAKNSCTKEEETVERAISELKSLS